MKQATRTKEQIIKALKEIGAKSTDRRVSISTVEDETGWDIRYWTDKYWPLTGYRGACKEADVQPGLIFGVETQCWITDAELASRLADVMQDVDSMPVSLKRWARLLKVTPATISREDGSAKAKERIINAYFDLPADKRRSIVDERLKRELQKLGGESKITQAPSIEPASDRGSRTISIPPDHLQAIIEKRGFGEEEQRQLIARLFIDVLGYHRSKVLSEIEQNDVRVLDRKGNPWLVVEVKKSLANDSEKQAARRQGFDYAHEHGMRYVVISDGDYYEIYDRFAGERLRYSDMREGSLLMSALRSRDQELLALLAAQV